MCANPVHYPYSIVVDGLEEIAVDKSSATIFEHTNIFFPYQRLKTYPPKISTSLPTDFVRNFCHLFEHSGKSCAPAGRCRHGSCGYQRKRSSSPESSGERARLARTFSMYMTDIAD
jgi:hypothetical protein